MTIFNRSSVLAIKEETTEGTIVQVAGATDFVAEQDGFSIEPNFSLLENAELKGSIGKAKGIQGKEAPTASFSHYLRHSGTEGTAPNYSLLAESALGTLTTNSTQRTTTSSSTTSVIKLGAGGSDFPRGKAMLIKDATNGYSIRPVDSFSSNDVTLGFNVGTAPASGVSVGKCVNIAPANTGHPTFSLWHYRGNGGALELISGARTAEMSIDFKAGELINVNYSLQGLKFHFNPITVGATDTKLDFTDDDGTVAATITAGVYRDPHELAAAITTAMNAANSGETHTCTYLDASGKFKIVSTGTTLSLLFSSGSNASNSIHDKLGFTTADKTGTAATTGYTSESAVSFAAPYTPSYDSADPLVAKYNEVFIGDAADTTCFDAKSVTVSINNNIVDNESVCAETGVKSKVIQTREVTVNVVGEMAQYDVEKFKNFRANEAMKFCYNFGTKSGGNWVAGTCGQVYIPSATITSFKPSEDEGICTVELEIKAYVDSSGNGEIYLNYL